MKKGSTWIVILLIAAAIVLTFVAVKFFVQPSEPAQPEITPETAEQEVIKEEPESEHAEAASAEESVTLIETAAPVAEVIDLTDTASNDLRIETVSPLEHGKPESEISSNRSETTSSYSSEEEEDERSSKKKTNNVK